MSNILLMQLLARWGRQAALAEAGAIAADAVAEAERARADLRALQTRLAAAGLAGPTDVERLVAALEMCAPRGFGRPPPADGLLRVLDALVRLGGGGDDVDDAGSILEDLATLLTDVAAAPWPPHNPQQGLAPAPAPGRAMSAGRAKLRELGRLVRAVWSKSDRGRGSPPPVPGTLGTERLLRKATGGLAQAEAEAEALRVALDEAERRAARAEAEAARLRECLRGTVPAAQLLEAEAEVRRARRAEEDAAARGLVEV